MHRVTPWLSSLLVLSCLAAGTARAESYPDDWLPVTPAERALADSRVEPGTDAEAVFVKVWVTDSYSSYLTSRREFYFRIKVFTPAGAQDFSKIDIDYPETDVRLTDVRARVIQPDGTEQAMDRKTLVTDTRVRKGKQRLRRTSFALSRVVPGSIVEYRYLESRLDDAAWVQSYDLQMDFPAQTIAYYLAPLQVPGLFARRMLFHSSAGNPGLEGGWFPTVVTNQPAYRSEPDSPPEYQVRPWMLVYYTTEALTTPQEYWPRYGRDEFAWAEKFTRTDRELTELAHGICASAADDSARVRAISDWLRAGFRIVRSSASDSLRAAGLHRNSDARDALRQRGGTALDADLALVALARAAGMEARLARVPDRSYLFFDENMMNPHFLGSCDAAVRVNGQWCCFDPSARYLPWDMLVWQEEAQPALLCDRDSSRFIRTPSAEPPRSVVATAGRLQLAEDGTLEGDVVTTCSGHENDTYRTVFADVAGSKVDSAFVEAIGWNEGGVEVTALALERGAHEWEPLVLRYHVRMPEHASVTGHRLILEPAAMHAHERARYTTSTRRSAVYFPYAWEERDSLRIELPAGWKVETVDATAPLRLEDGGAMRTATSVDSTGHALLTVRTLAVGEVGAIVHPAAEYSAVKKFFDLVRDRDRAAVTLVRVDAH